ncbi:MAG: histidinol-phosphatase [Clostridia bacterium]|nr:histidinol-phosphatase [Clostridia bacterium]
MLSNFHTHTILCDGKSAPEEVVLSAIEKGFSSIGFSGHAPTDFDDSYCLKDVNGYIATIKALKEKYQKEIEIYVGIEEDAYQRIDRAPFDYLLGSSHYLKVNGVYHQLDCGVDKLQKCLDAFGGNPLALAEAYYQQFTAYIKDRKPDIVGHFDLITKYEESQTDWFLSNPDYHKLAENYMNIATDCDVIFELNTGGIARGIRTTPYPFENLLHILKKKDAKIILNSDSHHKDTLDCWFSEAKKYLKDIGFQYLYTLYHHEFQKISL